MLGLDHLEWTTLSILTADSSASMLMPLCLPAGDGKFSQLEIEALYKRFRALDRGHKGYISAEEFMNIPELSINPLAHRLERLFESINFKVMPGLEPAV